MEWFKLYLPNVRAANLSQSAIVWTLVCHNAHAGPHFIHHMCIRAFKVVENQLPHAHCYAYDTQIYLSFKPNSSTSQHREEKALADPGLTPYNNDDKTEFMIIGTGQKLCKLQAMNIEVGSSSDTKPLSRKLKF